MAKHTTRTVPLAPARGTRAAQGGPEGVEVYHLDTHRTGLLFTKVKPRDGRVPVRFDGSSIITLCLAKRLKKLN